MSIYDGEVDQAVLDLLRDIVEHLARGGRLQPFSYPAEAARHLERGWHLSVDLRAFLWESTNGR